MRVPSCCLFAGDLAEVAALVQELQAATEATGINLAPYAGWVWRRSRGRQAETAALVDATIKDVSLRGEGIGIAVAEWSNAVLNNGLGSYEKAMRQPSAPPTTRWNWSHRAGRRSSSSRRQCAADTTTWQPTRFAGWPR